MTDILPPEKRSWNMSRIKGKNTKPEVLLRSLLHQAGFRFRIHADNLPGKPDIVLPRYNTAIFVNGCFWTRSCPLPIDYSGVLRSPGEDFIDNSGTLRSPGEGFIDGNGIYRGG